MELKPIRSYKLAISFAGLFLSGAVQGQTCDIWTVTNIAELTAAATATCANGGGTIKIATGTYFIDNPLNFCSNVTLEGGFDIGFTSKSSVLGASLIVRSANNPEGGVNAQRLVAIYLNTAANFRFQDISIQTVDGVSDGMSSYGVHMTNCNNYDFVRTQIIAGSGAVGLSGIDGVVGASGGAGFTGADGNNDDQNAEGIGGGGGSGGGVGGGTGGTGGSLPGCCSNGDPGTSGGNAGNSRAGSGGGGGASGGQEERPGGAGGTGGAFSGPNPCGGVAGSATGCQGNNGGIACAGTAGIAGTVGGSGIAGSHVAGFWVPGGQGLSGTDGTGGTGGGGGGGGGGQGGGCGFFCTCIDGAGSGGGGGGGGGEGGVGATGGYGGGASYSVYTYNNGGNGNFISCNFIVGGVGSGGTGGLGGTGGTGGAGGLGSPYTSSEVGAGGNGGAGGGGGDGGDGGVGAIGETRAIYVDGGTTPVTLDTLFDLAGQPPISVDNLSCTNVDITFSAGSALLWDLGPGAIPQGPLGSSVTTQYSSTGLKDVSFGPDLYSGFINISDSSVLAVITPSDSVELCGSDSVELFGNNGFLTYQWQLDGIDIPGATSNSLFATIAGSYTFYGTSVCCGATGVSAPVLASVKAQPVADAGLGGDACDSMFVFGATPSIGIGTWQQASGIGTSTFSNGNNPMDTVAVSNYGTYTFVWTELNSTCSSSDTVSVNFYEQPIVNPGVGGDACDSTFGFMGIPSAGIGVWTQVSSAGGGVSSFFPTANFSNADVTVSQYGTYVYQWTETNGVCVDSAQITVNFFENPIADGGPNGVECLLGYGFNAVPTAGTGVWSLDIGPASGIAIFSDSTNPSSSVLVTAPGTYIFTWTETNGSCVSSDDVIVDFSEPVIADAGADTSVSLGNSIVLNGQGGNIYTWSPATYLSDTGIFNPVAAPEQQIIYTLTVVNANGCVGYDSITIDVLLDYNFIVSNMLTPNGDGYNDTWHIENIDFYANCEVSIFNRYGKLLYSKTGYTNAEGWNGAYGGKALPDGTYYYVITCPNREEPFKGPITILKE